MAAKWVIIGRRHRPRTATATEALGSRHDKRFSPCTFGKVNCRKRNALALHPQRRQREIEALARIGRFDSKGQPHAVGIVCGKQYWSRWKLDSLRSTCMAAARIRANQSCWMQSFSTDPLAIQNLIRVKSNVRPCRSDSDADAEFNVFLLTLGLEQWDGKDQ